MEIVFIRPPHFQQTRFWLISFSTYGQKLFYKSTLLLISRNDIWTQSSIAYFLSIFFRFCIRKSTPKSRNVKIYYGRAPNVCGQLLWLKIVIVAVSLCHPAGIVHLVYQLCFSIQQVKSRNLSCSLFNFMSSFIKPKNELCTISSSSIL